MSAKEFTAEERVDVQRRLWISGIALAIGGTFLFALKSIFIKLCFRAGATVEAVLFLRMLLAAPFYLGMLVYLRKVQPQPVRASALVQMLGVGFLGYYLASFLDIAGLATISAQLERLTLFTYPTIVALLAGVFLGEKLTKWVLLSLVLCYGGLWVMYGQELRVQDGAGVTRGVLLVLGSACSYSLYVILAKPMIQRFGSRLFTSVAMLGSTVFVGAHVQCFGGVNLAQVSPIVWVYCAILAFVCTVFPSFMITEAISRIGATRTTILGSVGPLFTIVLAVFVIGEPFSWMHALGVLLVLLGVACVTRK